MVRVKGSKRWDSDGNRYWEVRYEIEYNEDTHLLEILDQGLRERITLPDGSVDRQRIKSDADGKEVQKPVKLDGAGSPLAVGGTPHYDQWAVYESKSWSSLSLPSSA